MKQIKINCNIENYIKLLSNDDIADIFKAVIAYGARAHIIDMSQNARTVFDIIKNSIDKQNESDTEKPINYAEIQKLYNDICVSLPKCKNLSTKRKQSIKKAINSYGVEKLHECFQKAESSKFLTGKTSAWHADFDWLINETNIAKVLDGRYDKVIEINNSMRRNSADFDNQRNYSKEELNNIFGDTTDIDALLEKL